MSKPITPQEVVSKKCDSLPDVVLTAFNEQIAESWNGYDSTFLQNDIIDTIIKKLKVQQPNLSTPQCRQLIFDKGYLDVESIYKAVGWKVEYDKPGYNESYEPSFKFTKGKSYRLRASD
jgi:hypothetical protein